MSPEQPPSSLKNRLLSFIGITPRRSFDQEQKIARPSLREAMFYLADAKHPTPLTPEAINPPQIKESLEQNDIKIEDLSAEARESLKQTKFRGTDDPDSRGFGVKEALGDKFDDWSRQIEILSSTYTWGIKGDKTRGLEQLTADIISVAAGVITPEQFTDRTNCRYWKAHDRKQNLSSEHLSDIFEGTTPPTKTTASFPLNAGVTLVSYLTDEN